ncbi:MAG: PEGA domain-containing protein [Gemmataceae bacterium]|nr:PEGA domain-containing protein [Gemmataceae bacterium]
MRGGWAILGVFCILFTGCVERRFVIESDPPGALVLVNGQPIGATPVDGHFLFYGKYQFTLIKDGYETLQVEECFKTPWYQYFPLDFASENLYPGRIEDVRRPAPFKLVPKMQPRTDAILGQADQFRNKGRSLQAPAATQPVTAVGIDPPAKP